MENEKNQTFSKIRFFIILLILLIGMALCIELSYIFYKTNFLTTFAPSFCAVSDLIDCDGVALTKYSVSLGVPNALWGIIIYSVILFLMFVKKIQNKFKNTIFDVFENPRSYITSISMFAFVASMYFAYVSIFEIHKICTLCFGTYIVDLLISIVSRTKQGFIYDFKTTILDFIKGAKKYFILFIIVVIAFVSTLIYLDRSLILSPKLKKERTQREFFEAKYNKYAIKGNILGKKDAKVIVNIYSDFNCPFCRIVNIMIHKIAKHKDIIVYEVNFPLDTTCNHTIGGTLGGHENSCMYSKYALAAQKQGKFWGAANVIFDKHPQTEEQLFKEFEKAHLDLDVNRLKQDYNSQKISDEIQQEIIKTRQKGIFATPCIEIDGIVYTGALPYEVLSEKIDLAIKRARN